MFMGQVPKRRVMGHVKLIELNTHGTVGYSLPKTLKSTEFPTNPGREYEVELVQGVNDEDVRLEVRPIDE